MTRGLVFGKFYPPHRGHRFLIERAAAQCDRLTVMVMADCSETIPGELRAAWLRETHPGVTVLHTPWDLPQSWPEDDVPAWTAFVEFVRRYHPARVDRIFSSEWYGDAAARYLGAEHIAVDPQRRVVPISATQIRAAPLAHLDDLEPCVRAYFVPRVVVCGAESTGKTTLAQRLAVRFDTAWVPEYGRDYCETVGHTAWSSHAWTTRDFELIARGQERRNDAAARTVHRVLICDTDGLVTEVWHERYLGVPARFEHARATLYLLADADVPFVQDGTRDGQHLRDWMTERFAERLRSEGVPFVRISGDWAEREHTAVAAIESLIGPATSTEPG